MRFRERENPPATVPSGKQSPTPKLPPDVVYRRLIYVDAEAVLDFLSVLHGGEVVDRYQSVVAESGGDVGGGISLSAFGAGLGVRASRRRASKFEEQVRMTTSTHSAVAEIMNVLRKDEHLSIIKSRSDLEKLSDNWLVQVPYRSISLYPPDPSAKPDSRRWFAKPFSKDRSVPFRAFVARIVLDNDTWQPFMAGHAKHLKVDVAEFEETRHATVLGQAEIVRDKEKIEPLVRSVEGGGECIASIAPLGSEETFKGPDLLVRPLCIYK
jgi:hypothetical protein